MKSSNNPKKTNMIPIHTNNNNNYKIDTPDKIKAPLTKYTQHDYEISHTEDYMEKIKSPTERSFLLEESKTIIQNNFTDKIKEINNKTEEDQSKNSTRTVKRSLTFSQNRSKSYNNASFGIQKDIRKFSLDTSKNTLTFNDLHGIDHMNRSAYSNQDSILQNRNHQSYNGIKSSHQNRNGIKESYKKDLFTLEDLKLLKQTIEFEKQELEKEINQIAKSDEKSPIKLSHQTTKKWQKAKQHLLALSRVRNLCKQVKLYGTSVHLLNMDTHDVEALKDYIIKTQNISDDNAETQKWYMIYPDSVFLNIWLLISIFLLLYTAFITPFSLAFCDEVSPSFLIIEYTVDGLFFMDMIVTLISAYYNQEDKLIASIRHNFWEYLKTWMIFDLISSIPFESVSSFYAPIHTYKLFRLPRLLRLLRLNKLYSYIKQMKTNKSIKAFDDFLQFNMASVRIISFGFTIIIIVHLVACTWYTLAKIQEFSPDTWVYQQNLLDANYLTVYIASVYWTVVTLSTVGYGDIRPYNNYERVFAICWMASGALFYSLAVGTLSSILANLDTRQSHLAQKLRIVDEFAKEAKLGKRLTMRIKRALEYHSIKNVFSQNERNEFFQEIPVELKFQISDIMHKGIVSKLTFFKNKDIVFIASVIPLLEPAKISKGEYLYKTGEYPNLVYFVISGRVSFVVGSNNLVFKTYVSGSYFGEIEILKNTARIYTMRAETDCDLLTLNRSAFLEILEIFPHYEEELRQIAEKRILRNHEAFRKIKKLLPITRQSIFWEKHRQGSIYDVRHNKDQANTINNTYIHKDNFNVESSKETVTNDKILENLSISQTHSQTNTSQIPNVLSIPESEPYHRRRGLRKITEEPEIQSNINSPLGPTIRRRMGNAKLQFGWPDEINEENVPNNTPQPPGLKLQLLEIDEPEKVKNEEQNEQTPDIISGITPNGRTQPTIDLNKIDEDQFSHMKRLTLRTSVPEIGGGLTPILCQDQANISKEEHSPFEHLTVLEHIAHRPKKSRSITKKRCKIVHANEGKVEGSLKSRVDTTKETQNILENTNESCRNSIASDNSSDNEKKQDDKLAFILDQVKEVKQYFNDLNSKIHEMQETIDKLTKENQDLKNQKTATIQSIFRPIIGHTKKCKSPSNPNLFMSPIQSTSELIDLLDSGNQNLISSYRKNDSNTSSTIQLKSMSSRISGIMTPEI